MNSIFGMFMESWILRVSCKESEAWRASPRLCKKYEVFMIPLTIQKLNLLLIFTFYNKYLKYKNIFNLGIKTVFNLKYNHILSECKMEKGNSQLGHGQPVEQTKGLFCTCNSGVAHCQSHHQYHFWRMSSMFEAYCTSKWAWQLSII